MFTQIKAHASALVTMLISATSLLGDFATEALSVLFAGGTAVFASYHYYHLAQLNKAKKTRILEDEEQLVDDE